jgi:hypothetical protein
MKKFSDTMMMNNLLLSGLLGVAASIEYPGNALFTPEDWGKLEALTTEMAPANQEQQNEVMIILVRTIKEIGARIIEESEGKAGWVDPDAVRAAEEAGEDPSDGSDEGSEGPVQ